MKQLTILFLALILPLLTVCATDLNDKGRDRQYVESIVKRSQKVAAALHIADSLKAQEITTIVANRYFELSDIYAERDSLKALANTLVGKDKQAKQDAAEAKKNSRLYLTHFAFEARLGLLLTNEEVEQVKDVMTYNVVNVTRIAYNDMIPTLKEDEKAQILVWLKEAREFAMDAENSKQKHNWFGKYKGRINNYLSKRGYDLEKERNAWMQRIAEKKK